MVVQRLARELAGVVDGRPASTPAPVRRRRGERGDAARHPLARRLTTRPIELTE
jgi:hypothetical protein